MIRYCTENTAMSEELINRDENKSKHQIKLVFETLHLNKFCIAHTKFYMRQLADEKTIKNQNYFSSNKTFIYHLITAWVCLKVYKHFYEDRYTYEVFMKLSAK
jgi:hypothetical protein